MRYFTMKALLVIIFTISVFVLTLINATPWEIPYNRNCECENFQVVSQTGKYIGNCLSKDHTGQYWCYLKKGCQNCQRGSGTFPNYCKNYDICQLAYYMAAMGAEMGARAGTGAQIGAGTSVGTGAGIGTVTGTAL